MDRTGYVGTKHGGTLMDKNIMTRRLRSQGFNDDTCSILQDTTRNKVAELYCTLWSLMSEKVHCKMPASIPTCHRDLNICEEMRSARIKFLCPEMGREISFDWRLIDVVCMVLSQKAFVSKKEDGAERPGIEYTSFPGEKAPSKTPSVPVSANPPPPPAVAMEEQPATTNPAAPAQQDGAAALLIDSYSTIGIGWKKGQDQGRRATYSYHQEGPRRARRLEVPARPKTRPRLPE